MGLGELKGVFANARDWIGEGGSDVGGLELAEAIEGPERVKAVEGVEGIGLGHGEDPAEVRDDIESLTFDEESLGGEAPPGIAMPEEGDEKGVLLKIPGGGSGGLGPVAMGDPPDATAIGSGADVLFLADACGDVIGVFDDLAVHVEEVEGAIGAHFEADRAEAGILAGDEFAMGFVGSATGDKDGAVGMDDFPMDEISDDVADEDGALKVGGPGRAAEEAHTAGGGEVAGLFRVIGAGDRYGDGKDAGHFAMIRDAGGGVEGGETGSTVDMGTVHEAVLDVINVVGGEPAAPVVLNESEPAPRSTGEEDPTGIGIEREVVVGELDGISGQFW